MFDYFFEQYSGHRGKRKTTYRERFEYTADKICASKHPAILLGAIVLFIIISISMIILSFLKCTIDSPIVIGILILLYFISTITIINLTPSPLQIRLSKHKEINKATKNAYEEYEANKIANFQRTCKDFGWGEFNTAKWILKEIEVIENVSSKEVKFVDYIKKYIILICYSMSIAFIGPFIDIVNYDQDFSIKLQNLMYVVLIVTIIILFCFVIGIICSLIFNYPSKKEVILAELKEVALYYIYLYKNNSCSDKDGGNKDKRNRVKIIIKK